MLLGPASTHKLDMLLQSALTLVNRDSSRPVLLFLPNLWERDLIHIHRMPKMDARAGEKVKFIYLHSAKDVLNYLCELRHERAAYLPQAMLFGDLGVWATEKPRNLFDGMKFDLLSIMMKIMALASEVASFISEVIGQTCFLMFSFTADPEENKFKIAKHISTQFADIVAYTECDTFLGVDHRKQYKVKCNDYVINFYKGDEPFLLLQDVRGIVFSEESVKDHASDRTRSPEMTGRSD